MLKMVNKKIALVTGANRGIGFEICRQLSLTGLSVILTARNREKGLKALAELKKNEKEISFFQLDVTSHEDIRNTFRFIQETYGKLDILVNNAGILIDKKPALQTDIAVIKDTLETNVYGPFQLIKEFVPLMLKSNDARIINFSSGLGALGKMGGGYPGYRISKAAINVLTLIFASELAGTNIKVNSMDPGWVKTGMGGSGAPKSVQEGAETAVWLATAPEISTGKFYRDKRIAEW